MESLLVHPENAEQLQAFKAFLKALKVQFEPQSAQLPSHVLRDIEIGIEQYENGQGISFTEFKEKHFSKK